MKCLTFGDKLVVAIVILIGILIALIFLTQSNNLDGLCVKIDVCGEEYAVYPLNNFEKTIEINTKFGYNEINIYNGEVWVSKTSCKDRLEMREGRISKEGQTLVCLPNRVVVSIISDKKSIDGVTY